MWSLVKFWKRWNDAIDCCIAGKWIKGEGMCFLAAFFSPWGITKGISPQSRRRLPCTRDVTFKDYNSPLPHLSSSLCFSPWTVKVDVSKINSEFWPPCPTQFAQKYQTYTKCPWSSPLSEVFYETIYLGERTDLNQQKNHGETEYLYEATSWYQTRWNPPRRLLRRLSSGKEIQQTRLSLTGLPTGKNHQSSDEIVLRDN